MPPHQQSKCCGCCCTSRIGVFVYCTVFGVLSLLGIVNFFPLPNSSLWFTFMMADVVSSANEYCNTYAISTPAEIGSGESFAAGQPPMSWETYGTPDCSGEPTWSWAEPTFPIDAASADKTCHAVDGGAVQGEWCDYSEEPPQLRGVYFVSSDCYPSSSGEDYAYVADGSCVVDGMGNSLRFYCGVFKEEYSVGRLGTCDEVCMCGDLPCDFAAQGAAHESGARLFLASVIMSIVLYIVGGVAACAYHKQALVVFAGGIVLVEILFGVSLIILTMAPMEVFKASFLWATASGYDPNGQASCTITWLTAVDGILGFGTITRWGQWVIGLAISAHMLFEVYKARRDIIEGANVHGGEEGGVPMQATATATATATTTAAPVAMATATAAPVAMATATAVPMATATPMATAVATATAVA